MESDESNTYSDQAGSSRCPSNYSQDSNASKQEVHIKITDREDGDTCETGSGGPICDYESDSDNEMSESGDESTSDLLSDESCEESDSELVDDDNGNDENGNIKELNDGDIEEDDWESMDEDDEYDKVECGNNFDAGMDSDSSNDHSERCPICLNRFIGQIIGTPESCDHSFCLECLLEWSKNINTCPVDRKVYNQILSRNEVGGSITEKIHVSAPVVEDEQDDEEVSDVTYCEVCGQCDREDRLLLCDFCDNGYHCECLTPPLHDIPVHEWYCPRCIIAGNAEANTQENADNTETLSRTSRIHRAIARTQATESVRHRIQQRRMTSGGTRSRSTITRRRKVKRRRRTTRKSKTRKSGGKKLISGIKQKSSKKSIRKPRRKRRKLSRRKRKTRRALATTRPLKAPTIRKRIADKIGMTKPRPGQTLPQIKRPCLTHSINTQRYVGGVPQVQIFGHRNDLDIVEEDYSYENSNTGGVATVQCRAPSHRYLEYARLPGKQALSLERRISVASPLTTNADVLGVIFEGQEVLLCKKSSDIYILKNGSLKVKSPNDGLEQKPDTESSDDRGKDIHGNPENEDGAKTNEPKGSVQSTSSNLSSSVDMFDSDNNEKHMGDAELSHDVQHSTPKENKENKARKQQRRNILNYGALQLYSDVEDDEENEALWRPSKKRKNMNADKDDGVDKPVQEANSTNQNTEIDKFSGSKSEKVITTSQEKALGHNDSTKNAGSVTASVCTELDDNEPGSLGADSDSGILQHLLEEKEQNLSALMPAQYDNTYKDKNTSVEKQKKEDSRSDDDGDDYTDIAPRVNIAVLPKIPKIKREKDEKQEEVVNSESGRHSVLSKVDEGSQDTRWNKLSRFSRDKNSSDNKSERSFSDHSSRSKQDNFRWSNDRNNRDNRHWRERDDGDHYRDRRHGERQREQDRWERPWKSDQRNRFDNYNYGNDNRKKYSRDNRSGNFRDRKDFPRGRSGRSPLKEYSRDKERTVGGKRNANERDGMYRDIPNRNYNRKFSSYDDVAEIKKGAINQSSKFEDMEREMESDIANIENENINNDQCLRDDLLTNSPLTQSISLGRKHSTSPHQWQEKQEMEELEARENFWKIQDEERHQPMQCDNADNANLKGRRMGGGYRKLRSPSPPSPPENESYDPFDPTESPVHKCASQMELSLDIPLPDRNDGTQNMKSLESMEDKPMMVPPPQRFSQPFDQSNNCNFIPRASLPNVHIPPPNFIIHAVPRPPFGNMVPQPNVQPFNWSAAPPPPAILVPPMIHGNFLPPPLPPRMISPQCAQPQMSCIPPHGPPPGPPPGPMSVMTSRGIQNSGPFVPNLPPPPMQNLNLPPQITLTNIAHPPPPPPPPSSMINTVQNSAPSVIPSHPLHNAAPPRPLFIPPVTTSTNSQQDPSLPVASNQVVNAFSSPLAVSSSTSNQSTNISNAVSSATVPTTTTDAVVQSTSKKNDITIPNSTTAATSELPKKTTNSETTNQPTAPSDVTDIVDMEVDSPFSPTNSPIDFDDVSLASSSEKSTPSPIGREVILSSPRPKYLAAKHAAEVSGPKSSMPLKIGNKATNDLTITENSKSNKIISCGQSLLEEVWAKHILSDASSKGASSDLKKKPSEKVRVVRDASAKEALKLEGSAFKMDEDQLKILDEIPSSAVEMQVKEKYMKKLNRQERVIEEVKLALKPYYNRRDIDKEEYKEILRKCVPKICHNRSGSIIPKKVKILVEAYVEKFSYHRKKGKDKPFPNT